MWAAPRHPELPVSVELVVGTEACGEEPVSLENCLCPASDEPLTSWDGREGLQGRWGRGPFGELRWFMVTRQQTGPVQVCVVGGGVCQGPGQGGGVSADTLSLYNSCADQAQLRECQENTVSFLSACVL